VFEILWRVHPPRLAGNQGVIAYHALWATRRQAHGSGILSFLESYGTSMPPRPGNQGVIAYHALWATRRQAHGSIGNPVSVTFGVSIVMFERCCKQSQAKANTHALPSSFKCTHKFIMETARRDIFHRDMYIKLQSLYCDTVELENELQAVTKLDVSPEHILYDWST
jgi:hypothetical protein